MTKSTEYASYIRTQSKDLIGWKRDGVSEILPTDKQQNCIEHNYQQSSGDIKIVLCRDNLINVNWCVKSQSAGLINDSVVAVDGRWEMRLDPRSINHSRI